jgi:uncharacterized protein (DUF1015 family)
VVHHVVGTPPDREFVDRGDQHNRLWAIRDPELVSRLREHLAASRPLIADGHHRFAAYLRMQEARPGTPADRGLAMLVDQDDTPLFLGAIHRTLTGPTLDELAEAAAAAGAGVVRHDRARALSALDSTHLVLTDGERWHTVSPGNLDQQAAVSWLHDQVLTRLPCTVSRIAYHHAVDDALAAAAGTSPAVLLPSPDFEQVRTLVESGGLLPEKATSFQPKPALGVLMRPMSDG